MKDQPVHTPKYNKARAEYERAIRKNAKQRKQEILDGGNKPEPRKRVPGFTPSKNKPSMPKFNLPDVEE